MLRLSRPLPRRPELLVEFKSPGESTSMLDGERRPDESVLLREGRFGVALSEGGAMGPGMVPVVGAQPAPGRSRIPWRPLGVKPGREVAFICLALVSSSASPPL